MTTEARKDRRVHFLRPISRKMTVNADTGSGVKTKYISEDPWESQGNVPPSITMAGMMGFLEEKRLLVKE